MKANLDREKFEAAMLAKATNMNRIAVALGVAGPVVVQWKTGRCGPTLANALRLCALLDVDPRDLWTVHP